MKPPGFVTVLRDMNVDCSPKTAQEGNSCVQFPFVGSLDPKKHGIASLHRFAAVLCSRFSETGFNRCSFRSCLTLTGAKIPWIKKITTSATTTTTTRAHKTLAHSQRILQHRPTHPDSNNKSSKSSSKRRNHHRLTTTTNNNNIYRR